MKEKKYPLALAIFGLMLFSAYVATEINFDEQQTAQIEKSKIKKIPTSR
ncbi:hypothetical protein [Tamlana sp. I1]|nr:hypothetical protein [Tamlana sp. I1]